MHATLSPVSAHLSMPGTREPSGYLLIRQTFSGPLRRISIVQPSMFVIRRGHKTVTVKGRTLHAMPGTAMILSAGCHADMINQPDADGIYEADAFRFGEETLRWAAQDQASAAEIGTFASGPAFRHSVLNARAALATREHLPSSVVTHRVVELVLWARYHGINPTARGTEDLAGRLRHLIAAEPARDWRTGALAAQLAMSEPTLRRHLAAAGTSATEILTDVRLTAALTWLQTTSIPITQIAFDAGYLSPSRFAARFRARFGVSPSQIRTR
jgi:AraC-like DNA-binding protein